MPLSILRNPLTAVAAVLACLSLTVTAQSAHAQTLVGEHFQPAEHIEALSITGTCNAEGPSTFTFSSFGPATGPVPGEYSTYGSFTLASPAGPVTSYTEDFAIFGDAADASGSQALGDSVDAWCTPGETENLEIRVNTAYGVLDPFTEQGPGIVSMAAAAGWAISYTADFGQQAPPPPPPLPSMPTTKEQCLGEGWKTFDRFKNQGDCISYVVHLNKAV